MGWLFILGLMLGSFFNVVIWRIPRKESLIHPGSHCPRCKIALSTKELIPVLSYLFQKGRCIHCGKKISWRYPAIELLTGFGFVICGILVTSWQELIVALIFFSILLVVSLIDIDHKLIPNIIVLPGIGLGIIFALLGWSIPLAESLLGFLVGGGILLIFALFTRGMGMGDVKFLALIGTFLGVYPTLVTLFIGSLIGAIVGLVYLYVTKQDNRTPIPFGPFLAIGAIIAAIFIL